MDHVAQWLLEDGARWEEPFTTEGEHADPDSLFGPGLDAIGLAALVNLGPRTVRLYAAETVKRNKARIPLPLLLRKKGDPLPDPAGNCFAIVAGEGATGRGRPATTRGEKCWQFQRVAAAPRYVRLPSCAVELSGCGPDEEGIPISGGGLLQSKHAVVTVTDPRPGRWASAVPSGAASHLGGVTYYRDHSGNLRTADVLAQARFLGMSTDSIQRAEQEMLRNIRQQQRP